ncbi:MAG: hypothetical protein ACRENE_00910 [Polyangiaceae bacterium]
MKLVVALAIPGVALTVGAGACSSSSSGGSPAGSEGGSPEAGSGSEAGEDGGTEASVVTNDAGLSLTWGVALVRGAPPPPENLDGSVEVLDGAAESGASDAASDGGIYTVVPEDGGYYNGGDGGAPAVFGASARAYTVDSILATGNWTLPAQSAALGCTTSKADGTFEIPNLPIRTNVALVVSKAGYQPVVRSLQTASSPMDVRQYPIYLYDPGTNNDPPGVTVDYQNKGEILVFDIGSADDAGAAVAMSSQADGATPAGVGPVYQALNGAIVPAASSYLPNAGTLGLSLAEYYNVPAGIYTLSMTDSADDCEPSLMPLAGWGFPITQPKHSIQALVLDGYLSGAVGFICTPNPVLVATGDGG